ncbi:partial UDP-N-acetylglucosamine 2-epimerase, partial [Candidatus Brocadiaceae bacterium]
VTTEFDSIAQQAKNIVDAALESGLNYIVVYPNNDLGSDFIFQAFKRFENKSNIKLVTSFRFEYFITFLKHALFVLGNSSSGIMEAPYFQVPTVNVGTRQNNRVNNHEIINTDYDKNNILKGIFAAVNSSISGLRLFGNGNSDKLFYKILLEDNIWEINKQKLFQDLSYTSGNGDLTVRNGNSSLATVDDVQ